MKAATINELKQELSSQPSAKLLELCLRMARSKKENKELLTYLLFEADDEQAYIENIKKEIDHQFETINRNSFYFAKKSLRKIVRSITKYIRHSGSKQVEVEVLLHFCSTLKNDQMQIKTSSVLVNLYKAQLKKIQQTINSFHEDLQYDYQKIYDELAL